MSVNIRTHKQSYVREQPHYTAFKMQPIEFFRANIKTLDFLQMCIIKYVCRFRLKGGLKDLDKAQHYLDMLREDYIKETQEAQK